MPLWVGHSQFSATYLFSGQGLQNVQKLCIQEASMAYFISIIYPPCYPLATLQRPLAVNGWDLVVNILPAWKRVNISANQLFRHVSISYTHSVLQATVFLYYVLLINRCL